MYRGISGRIGFAPMRSERKAKSRCCNICGKTFHARTMFDRYCGQCKEGEELLKFSDWLPEIDDTMATRIPA